MAKTLLSYTTANELTRHFQLLQAVRSSAAGGQRTTIKELVLELADYCGLQYDAITMIKRNRNQPSLPVAMKIADYFGVPMENLFRLVPQEREDRDSRIGDPAGA